MSQMELPLLDLKSFQSFWFFERQVSEMEKLGGHRLEQIHTNKPPEWAESHWSRWQIKEDYKVFRNPNQHKRNRCQHKKRCTSTSTPATNIRHMESEIQFSDNAQ